MTGTIPEGEVCRESVFFRPIVYGVPLFRVVSTWRDSWWRGGAGGVFGFESGSFRVLVRVMRG